MLKTAPGGADSDKRATPTTKQCTRTGPTIGAPGASVGPCALGAHLVAQALAQGFGPTVTDPVALRRIGRLFATAERQVAA